MEFIRYEQEVIPVNKSANTQAPADAAEDEELPILCNSETPLQAEVDQPEPVLRPNRSVTRPKGPSSSTISLSLSRDQ